MPALNPRAPIPPYAIRFAHVLSCVAEVPAHGMAVKSIVFMPDGSGLMTGSMDKSIKMWDLRPSPPSSQSIAVDGEVMHLTVEGPFLLWANSILPAYTPSDPVGVVELMDLASNVRVKCVVSVLHAYCPVNTIS